MKVDKGVSVANIVPEKATSFESSQANPGIQNQWDENPNKDKTRSSWLNYALRDDEAVYWISIGLYEAVAEGNWWYWVSRGHLCLCILIKVEIWTGVMDALLTHSLTDWQTSKDRAAQLLKKYMSGALVTQFHITTTKLKNWTK